MSVLHPTKTTWERKTPPSATTPPLYQARPQSHLGRDHPITFLGSIFEDPSILIMLITGNFPDVSPHKNESLQYLHLKSFLFPPFPSLHLPSHPLTSPHTPSPPFTSHLIPSSTNSFSSESLSLSCLKRKVFYIFAFLLLLLSVARKEKEKRLMK